MRLPRSGAAVIAAALLMAGCGEHQAAREHEHEITVADQSVCSRDAHRLASLPKGFPAHFPLPPGAVAYAADDRGHDGVVVTAIVPSGLEVVLAHLNTATERAGFKVTDGETEEHDAEADWAGRGYRGRWAIKDSATCPGETLLQVVARAG